MDATYSSKEIHASMNRRRSAMGGDVVADVSRTTRTPDYYGMNPSKGATYSFQSHIEKLRADPTLAEPLKSNLVTLFTQGYVIIPDFLSEIECRAIERGMELLLEDHTTGRNAFEGLTTQRCYALLGKSKEFEALAMHPKALEILDRILLPNYLLTAYQGIKILPGEKQQSLHTDDSFIKVPRPRQPFSVAFIYAIDDFTADNGSTVVVPNSHVWGDDRVPDPAKDTIIPAVMKRGSAICFLSTTWHGGGANTSNGPRLALTAQYVEPYARPQENQFLLVPHERVLQMPRRLQSLLGWSIHPPFIGFANGEHPLKRIDPKTGQLLPLEMNAGSGKSNL